MNKDRIITVTNNSGLIVAKILGDRAITCAGYRVDILDYINLTTIGERLKALIASEGLTQRQFSDMIGATQSSVSNWASDRRDMSASVAVKISRTFQVSLDWLLGSVDGLENVTVESAKHLYASTLDIVKVNDYYEETE